MNVRIVAVLLLGWTAGGLVPLAAEAQSYTQPVYGSQLMSEQERNAHQQRLREAKTEQERQRIRDEHHLAMQERARQRGVTLSDPSPSPPSLGAREKKGERIGKDRGMGSDKGGGGRGKQ